MNRWLMLILTFVTLRAAAQAPANDLIDNAITITHPEAYCSADAAYTNVNATSVDGPSTIWKNQVGKDVWYKFTATKFDVSITVTGKVNAASTNTMLSPLIALYTRDETTRTIGELPGGLETSNNVSSFYKGALVIGQVYYIRVSANDNNEGTFKLCVDNYFPPVLPGQDCSSFSVLCSMEKFTQVIVAGVGNNRNETAGTCLGTESNSVWYKWVAAKSGAFTFLITPTNITNDIDWVLYDLGPDGDCSKVTAENAIRCASGSGVQCTPSYYITGLSMTETDLTEQSGCPAGKVQNGLLRYVDMVAGHSYALIVDNFSSGVNGFNIEFGGTTAFTGPTSDIKMERLNTCSPQQAYQFTSLATNYNSLKWTFGEGASISTATTEGPLEVTYTTPGDKVVVLEAKTSNGCNVVSTVSFTVALKPALPTIEYTTEKLCVGNTVSFKTPQVKDATYHWSGPNGFSSESQNPVLTITGPETAGNYELYIQVADCKSDLAALTLPFIEEKPVPSYTVTTNFACEDNLSFTFKNTSNYADATWDFGDGVKNITNGSNGDKTVSYLTSGTKSITLRIKNPTGCSVTLTQELIVQLKPAKPTISSNTVKYCPGNDVILSTAAIEGATYHWIGPNDFASAEQNPKVVITGPENAGDYQLTIEVGGCKSDAGTINVPTIDLKPEAAFTIMVNNPCLANQSFTFKNGAKNYAFLTWDFGSGATTSFTAANGDVTVTYTQTGTKDILLTATSPSGCIATFSQQINVQLKPTTPVIKFNQAKFCLGDILKMEIADVEGLSYQWTGPNNFTANTAAVTIPITNFNQAGVYQVVVQIGDCKSDAVQFTVPPIARVPIASFTASPGYEGKYAAPFPIAFKNNSLYADSYLWDFGDGTTSTAMNPNHTFYLSGTYKIKLTAFADEGCFTTTDIGDLVINDARLFIPNTFTPNGDGVNDEFVVTVLNLIKYKITIYNRVGIAVYESFNIFKSWNGTYQNQEVPVGVYYYVITGTNVDNKAVKHSGSLTLIR
jgi:gliding motility-associated-like protein